MRKPMLVVALLAGLFTPAHAAVLAKCAPFDQEVTPVREHPVARIRAIYLHVLGQAGFPINRFALCESNDPVPQIRQAHTSRGIIHEVLFPSYVAAYTDSEIEGLISHELGHVPLSANRPLTVLEEMNADEKGKRMVGRDSVTAGLSAIQRDILNLPTVFHRYGFIQLETRIRKLLSEK